MKNRRIAAAVAAATLVVTGFVSVSANAAAAPQVGVVLPDSASSVRWESFDRPLLAAAFAKAGVTADIQNALGDKSKWTTIAQGMITKKVKVLILVNLDSPSAAAIEASAKKAGIATIDYDRLTLGGSASYYVSFDNVGVGKLQGQGIVNCLKAKNVAKPRIVYLNGSPTDNNATLFKAGYDSVIRPLIKAGTYTLVDDKSVPNWDNTQGGVIFEQQLTKAGKKLDAVVSANEGLGLAAAAVLKKNGLNGKVCVSGQDASPEGLAAILTHDLSNTVYKKVALEAAGASDLAIALIKGTKAATNGTTADSSVKGRSVPSILLTPISVTDAAGVKAVIADKFVSRADVCKAATEAVCKAAGI
jgi:D-xylose transport system substrate-binding protein